jgi:hypothetical protein
LSRFTPGLFSVAPQLDEIPLVPNPNANTITRPLPGTSITAVAWASVRFRLAPTIFIFALVNDSNVSKSPEYPQSAHIHLRIFMNNSTKSFGEDLGEVGQAIILL